MTVGDYADLLASETSFDHPKLSARSKDRIAAMTASLGKRLWAVKDAPAARGQFPTIIYAPSFSAASWENADLCEYLASYGYMVISSPGMGARGRAMTSDLEGIQAQARDIEFLVGYARTLASADPSEVAVIGFSWGGISNLFAAAHDDRIDALVALDGSMRYWSGLIKDAGDVHPDEITIPLLYFEGQMSVEDQAELPRNDGRPVLNAWKYGDLFKVHMLGLVHGEFSAMNQRSESFWKRFPMEQEADYGRDDGTQGYAWVARYTLMFLNAYLKHDGAAAAWLKNTPAQNGVPPHLLASNFRGRTEPVPSFQGFRTEVGRGGFTRASEIYAAMRKVKPDLRIDQGALTAWATDLLDDDRFPEAIALLKLNVSINPTSIPAALGLGDAYKLAGRKQLAIDTFREALKLNPDDPRVLERLADLEGRADSVPK